MKLTVGQIVGIIVGVFSIIAIISMYFAMIGGDIEKGTEILAGSLIPSWFPFLASGSIVVIIIVLLVIFFWDKIKNVQFSV